MPPGAKKRRAAKKKQEQASSNQINFTTKANNNDSLSSQENLKNLGSGEDDSIRIEKEADLDRDERIEITDSSHDHDKSSSSSSHSSSSSSSSDDESKEVKKSNDIETGDSATEVTDLSSVVNQPVPIAGDAPFTGSTANVIVENTGLINSTMPAQIKSGELTHISSVDTNETDEKSLVNSTEKPAKDDCPVSDEIMQASSGAIDSKVKEPEANGVTEEGKEASVGATHGIARRTSLFSCCGLFDVITGSSR